MCFIEFIGYTCGHTSVPLNRECPMTTHLHSNPCCPLPATRPFLASEMCPPCARIVHGRWVQILEMEHRFMHERGACGCEVRFPALQQPRMLSAMSNQGEGAGSSQVPPLFQGGSAHGVAVRLPSLYGAEWTLDHAKLHESGQCYCRVQFTQYQSPLLGEYDNDLKREASEELHGAQNNGKKKDILPPVADPVLQDPYAPSTASQQFRPMWPQVNSSLSQSIYPQLINPTIRPPRPHSHAQPGPTYSPAPLETASTHPGSSSGQQEQQQQQQQHSYSHNPQLAGAFPRGMGEPARWACSPPDLYPLDAALGPVGPSAEQQAAHPVDLQSMSIQWHQQQVPIASLPIGAGCEGDPHTPPFAECPLSRENRMRYFREQLRGQGQAGGTSAAAAAAATAEAVATQVVESEGEYEDDDEDEGSVEDDSDDDDDDDADEEGYDSDPSWRQTRSRMRRSCSTEF